MSPYIKGAIAAVVIAGAVLAWYQAKVSTLPVNQSPAKFGLITKMEKEGAPDFSSEKIGEGKPLKLSDYKGKIVILNFWASWCNPCVEEFPSMMKLIETVGSDVVIVAVSGDDEKKDVETFMKAFGLPKPGFDVVWDKDKAIMQAYGVEKVPESFIIARDGRLIRKVLGIENWASPDAIAYFERLKKGAIEKGEPEAGKSSGG